MKRLILKETVLAMAVTLAPLAVTQPAFSQLKTVTDPVGDVKYHAPAFQDIVSASIEKTIGGYTLRMTMAGAIPEAPPLPPPGTKQIWWVWAFNVDPANLKGGFPFAPGFAPPAEFMVYLGWNGSEFKAYMIDRRPLLTGGTTLVTEIPFSFLDGRTTIEVHVLLAPNGNPFPASFLWGSRTFDWSSHNGTQGFNSPDEGGEFYNLFP